MPHPYSQKDGEEFVQSQSVKRRRGSDLALLVFEKEDGRLVGGTGFHSIDWSDRRFELGYWVAPSEWGRGIATEVAHAVCRVAFTTLRFHRVYANVLAFNHRSARVLGKLGFRLEGRAREDRRDGRRWVDLLRFGLLTGELREPPAPSHRF